MSDQRRVEGEIEGLAAIPVVLDEDLIAEVAHEEESLKGALARQLVRDEHPAIEDAKTESYELGKLSARESFAEELRERAGEVFAEADGRPAVEKANQLKDLAREMEAAAEEERERCEEEDGG